jgi:hypothetical protein
MGDLKGICGWISGIDSIVKSISFSNGRPSVLYKSDILWWTMISITTKIDWQVTPNSICNLVSYFLTLRFT